jgi:hypothetical protein
LAATSWLAALRNSSVLLLIELGLMSSLNVTVTVAVVATPVAPLLGVVDSTVGATVSAA